MILIDLHGTPEAFVSPTIARRRGTFIAYDSKKSLKEAYKWQVRSQYREEPLSAPLEVDVTFFMPIPKGTSGIKKRQMLNNVCFHMKRPDIDNLQKFLFDCLKEIVLQDDSQIVELRARKIYSDKPGTSVRIIPKGSTQENYGTYSRTV